MGMKVEAEDIANRIVSLLATDIRENPGEWECGSSRVCNCHSTVDWHIYCRVTVAVLLTTYDTSL